MNRRSFLATLPALALLPLMFRDEPKAEEQPQQFDDEPGLHACVKAEDGTYRWGAVALDRGEQHHGDGDGLGEERGTGRGFRFGRFRSTSMLKTSLGPAADSPRGRPVGESKGL